MSEAEAHSEFEATPLELAHDAIEIRFARAGAPISWRDAIALWQESGAWRTTLSTALADTPFEAGFWECPGVSLNSIETAFRCVVLDAPHLASMTCDANAFAEHFTRSDHAISFQNLGGDATLVAPTPTTPVENNTHLLRFLRTQDQARVHALWRRVGTALAQSLGSAPVWLSTCGIGVAWLHVRLDARPKYYRHAPFRAWPTHDSG